MIQSLAARMLKEAPEVPSEAFDTNGAMLGECGGKCHFPPRLPF
jgi:hypothetical protein